MTPPGRVIATILNLEAGIASAVAWAFIAGLDINLRWLGLPPILNTNAGGFLWATTAAFLVNQFHFGMAPRVSIARHLAPYFGHRLYRTYRALTSRV